MGKIYIWSLSSVRKYALIWLVGMLLLPAWGYAQTEIATAKKYLTDNAQRQQLSQADIDGMLVSSAYRSPTTGWYHIYFNQSHQSVEVHNRLMNVVLKDNAVAYLTHNFVPNPNQLSGGSSLKGRITPLEAVLKASAHLGIANLSPGQILELPALSKLTDGTLTKTGFSAPALSKETIDVKLYWLPTEVLQKGQTLIDKLVLTWQVTLTTKDYQNRWSLHLDASSGKVLRQVDEVIHCNFGTPAHTQGPHVCRGDVATLGSPAAGIFGLDARLKSAQKPFAANSYTVFDYPLEAPTFGNRTVSTNPYTRFVPTGTGPGATNGWHNDGSTDYTNTRGNNVWAKEDVSNTNGTGASPSSATLEFDNPYAFAGQNTASGNQNAAITNLFYWNNLIHDVLYKYGFDEPSGNFQASNMGRGGAGNDFIYADAQDGGGTNNANFSIPVDGGNGRMQMYLWSYTGTYQPDGDFDNGIIAHEYGHGWSTRLTGGPNNSSCLQNAEQGGEGWSDYLALMLTTNWSSLSANIASANIPRSIGTYALGQPNDGAGIRPYQYSYDKANVNDPVTYARVADYAIPHGIGSIWATMLWDMTWEIILQDGQIVNNIYDTPGTVTDMKGNLAALKLVNEGLRLQPCSPSFVQARDAILQADQMLFNGRYRCAIGRAFARRGLGANASTGSSANDRVVTEDYTPIGGTTLSSATSTSVCTDAPFNYTATSATSGATYRWARAAVSGISNAAASANSAVISETLFNTTTSPITVIYSYSVSPDACSGTAVLPVRVTVYPAVVATVASYSICLNGSVPGGQGLVVPITSSSVVNGSTTTSSPTYVRPSGNNVTVYSAGSTVYYMAYSFTAPASGDYTFQTTASTFASNDTYLALYQNAFTPSSPATNFLRGDDDSGASNYLSRLTHTLTAGTTYIIVVSSYSSGNTGTFTLQASSPVFTSGTPNWYTAASGGSPIYSGTVFNPIGVSGSGISNAATAGTTPFYVSTAELAGCRRTTTFTIQTDAAPVPSTTSVTIPQGGSVTLNATGCMGTLRWYQSSNNALVTMPVSPSVTTQYYARCERTATNGNCLSQSSATVTVTVNTPTSFDSVTSGSWDTPGTWNCNCIPNGTLPVRIMNTHTVTVPSAYTGQAKGVKLVGSGKIRLLGAGKIRLLN